MNQFYQGLSNTTLTREPGSQFEYSTFDMGLLGHILSLKAGIPYEQLVSDKILKVLGMNDTKITLTANDIKTRLAHGHKDGQEISTHAIPDVIAGGDDFRSSVNDMLKYISAYLGLDQYEIG